MATIQDRHNPSRKATVTETGELVVKGSNADGSISVTEGGDESTIIDDQTTSNITYLCYAETGTETSASSWKIKVIDETSGYPVIKYADGNDSYDNIADNRASLSYS